MPHVFTIFPLRVAELAATHTALCLKSNRNKFPARPEGVYKNTAFAAYRPLMRSLDLFAASRRPELTTKGDQLAALYQRHRGPKPRCLGELSGGESNRIRSLLGLDFRAQMFRAGNAERRRATFLEIRNLLQRNLSHAEILERYERRPGSTREAIEKLEPNRRASTKLLLSATPFQLEPRQWNALARHMIKSGHKVLSRKEIRDYLDKVAAVFRDPKAPGPSTRDVDAASATLRKIAGRSIPRQSRRKYSVLLLNGDARPLSARLDELDEPNVNAILERLRQAASNEYLADFRRAYFNERLRLARGDRPTFVATVLRRFLAKGTPSTKSPRLQALKIWARNSFVKDFEKALETGLPHKTIVFTSWVGDRVNGEAALLRNSLELAFSDALTSVKLKHRNTWKKWRAVGLRRLRALGSEGEPRFVNAIRALAQDELTIVLSGAHRGFLTHVSNATRRQLEAVRATELELEQVKERRSIESRALRRRLNDMLSALNPWEGRRLLRPVERYTGGDERTARDRAATAFRQIGAPWVLVASQVGAEGIDLQTYTHRIVHYDLEWNPARMEQREGRGDRVGRQLEEKLQILYCIVPGTYDERMFHQLVARDRWHGVLLGKPAQALDAEQDAPLLDRARLRKMRLRLTPGA